MRPKSQASRTVRPKKRSNKAAGGNSSANSEMDLFVQSAMGLYGQAAWQLRKPSLGILATGGTRTLHETSLARRQSAPYRQSIRQVASRRSSFKTAERPRAVEATKLLSGPDVKREVGVFVGIGNALFFEGCTALVIVLAWYGIHTALL